MGPRRQIRSIYFRVACPDRRWQNDVSDYFMQHNDFVGACTLHRGYFGRAYCKISRHPASIGK